MPIVINGAIAPINGRKSLGNWCYFTPKSVELFHSIYNDRLRRPTLHLHFREPWKPPPSRRNGETRGVTVQRKGGNRGKGLRHLRGGNGVGGQRSPVLDVKICKRPPINGRKMHG